MDTNSQQNKLQKWYLYFFIFSILPFFVISFFSHPSADDFTAAVGVKTLGFFESQFEVYKTWSGRYIANFLMAASPISFDWIQGYQLIPIVVLFLLIHSVYFLAKAFLSNLFSQKEIFTFSMGLVCLFIFRMSSVSQGIYWASGAFNYTTPLIALNYAIALLWLNKGIFQTILLSLISVFIVGSNETLMVIWLLFLICLLVYEKIVIKKTNYKFIFFILVSLLAAWFVFSAPGNEVRAAQFEGNKDFFKTVGKSLGFGIWHFFRFLSLPMLVSLILLFPIIKKIQNQVSAQLYSKEARWFMYLVFAGVLFFTFAPAFWAMDSRPARRVLNMTCWLHYLCMISIYCQWVWTCDEKWISRLQFQKLKPVHFFSVIVICYTLLGNFRTVYYDLFSAKALSYHAEMQSRYDLFQKSAGQDVIVSPLKHLPKTIFFDDIIEDPSDWRNHSYAKYFSLNSLTLSLSESTSPQVERE